MPRTCEACGNPSPLKALWGPFPVRMCFCGQDPQDEDASPRVWGAWVPLAAWVCEVLPFIPQDLDGNAGWSWFVYEGPYWRALFQSLRGEP